MRVAHVITRLIVGGAQENTVASVLGLRQFAEFKVSLISGPTSGPEGTLVPWLESAGCPISVIPGLVRPVHPLKDVSALLGLTRLFRRSRPDLVHTHSGKAGILGRMAARLAGVPLVVHTIHGPSFGRFQGTLANAVFATAERWAGRMTTHFVAVSAAMIDQYLAAGIGSPQQYSRILSGFSLEPFLQSRNDPALRRSLGLSDTDFVVGKVARLTALKGHEDLFEAFRQLSLRVPSSKLLLMGDGPWRAKFEVILKRMDLRQRVLFAGLITPERIPDYLGVVDVLVHLSYREGLPRALPQAMAASKPVVAYDCDGAGEVCLQGRTGFLVPPGRPEIVAERLTELAENPVLRAQLGQAGRELVRGLFPVERMVDELRVLYARLAEAAGVGARLPREETQR